MVEPGLTNRLNLLLEEYFDDFLRGKRTLEQMMPEIYRAIKGNFETEFDEAITINWYDNRRLINDYRNNINKWSIARNYKQTKEITDFLYVNMGDITQPKIEEFLTSNKSRYNQSWLDTEIKTLRNTVQNVNNFETFPADSYLRYSTANDEKVRHAHAALDGLTMAKNDGRWQYLMPPPASSPFNCRCRVVPVYNVDESKDVDKRTQELSKLSDIPLSKVKSEVHPIWSGEIFNSSQTYFKGVPSKILRKNEI